MPFHKGGGRFFAVIDIGSNSVKISIAKLTSKDYSVLIEEKEPLRLLPAKEKLIQPKGVKALVKILKGFVELANAYDCDVRTIATSAMRRAQNREAVCQTVFKQTGLKIEIISGDQETDYIVAASKHRFDLRKGKHWLIDVGGGSVEMALLQNSQIVQKCSMSLGAVVLKGIYFKKNSVTRERVRSTIGELYSEIKNALAYEPCDQIFVSGGAPAAIAKIIQVRRDDFSQHLHGMTVWSDDLRSLLEKLIESGTERLNDRYGISKSRTDLVVPAICLIQAFLHFALEKKYIVSRTGLREGVICSQLQQASSPSRRLDGVLQ